MHIQLTPQSLSKLTHVCYSSIIHRHLMFYQCNEYWWTILIVCFQRESTLKCLSLENRIKDQFRNNITYKDILPKGGGANKPLISSAFKRGTSSIKRRSFNHLRVLLLLTWNNSIFGIHNLEHTSSEYIRILIG